MTKRLLFFFIMQISLLMGLALQSGALEVRNDLNAPQSCEFWLEVPLSKDHWSKAYDGYGKIQFKEQIALEPATPAHPDMTHAALVLMNEKLDPEFFGVRVLFENIKPLRGPAANPWEVFWLFFNYEGPDQNKKTNYLILKPNGVELGKAWGLVEQEFLRSQKYPTFDFGKTHELTVLRTKNEISAFANGENILQFHAQNGTSLFSNAGQIGLYTEDALVHIKKVEICQRLKTFTN